MQVGHNNNDRPHRENPYYSLIEIPAGYLNIMGYVDESEVNGPGCRAVIWMQGCLRECQDCYNPASWSFEINQLVSVDSIVERILKNPRNEGVTFSGGEPFWQAPALAQVAKRVKEAGLNVMSFTGFTLDRLQSDEFGPAGANELIEQLDVLIDGPYVESLSVHSDDCPVSSSNQRVYVFNPELKDRITWASDQMEIHILKDGSRIITGYYGQYNLSELENS